MEAFVCDVGESIECIFSTLNSKMKPTSIFSLSFERHFFIHVAFVSVVSRAKSVGLKIISCVGLFIHTTRPPLQTVLELHYFFSYQDHPIFLPNNIFLGFKH